MKHSKFLKDSEKELIPDKEGMVTYSYKGEFEVNSMVSQLAEDKSDLNILYGDEEEKIIPLRLSKKTENSTGVPMNFLGNKFS